MLMLPRKTNVYKRNRRWQYDRKVNVRDSFRPVAAAPGLVMHALRAPEQQKGPQLRGMRPDLRATRRLERFDARRQPRQFTCDGVPVQHALERAALQLGLRHGEGGARRLLVACGDGCLDFLDEGPDAAQARAVDRRAPCGLADALFCRNMSGHRRTAVFRPGLGNGSL